MPGYPRTLPLVYSDQKAVISKPLAGLDRPFLLLLHHVAVETSNEDMGGEVK